MNAFEYASPTSVEQAVRALAGAESSEGLSGGTDLLSRMKDYITSPERVVYLKEIEDDGFRGVGTDGDGLVHRRRHPPGRPAGGRDDRRASTRRSSRPPGRSAPRRSATWRPSAATSSSAPAAGTTAPASACSAASGERRRGQARPRAGRASSPPTTSTSSTSPRRPPRPPRRQPLPRHLHDRRRRPLRQPVEPGPGPDRPGRRGRVVGPDGERTVPVADLYRVPEPEEDRELTTSLDEVLTRVTIPRRGRARRRTYEIRQKLSHDWPLVLASVAPGDGRRDGQAASTSSSAHVAPVPYRLGGRRGGDHRQEDHRETAAAAGQAATEGAQPLSKNAYKVPLVKTAVKRALLRAVGNAYWEEMEA